MRSGDTRFHPALLGGDAIVRPWPLLGASHVPAATAIKNVVWGQHGASIQAECPMTRQDAPSVRPKAINRRAVC